MSESSIRSLGVPNRVICFQKDLSADVIMKKSQVPHVCHKISNSGNAVWDIVISPVGVFRLNNCVGGGSLPIRPRTPCLAPAGLPALFSTIVCKG